MNGINATYIVIWSGKTIVYVIILSDILYVFTPSTDIMSVRPYTKYLTGCSKHLLVLVVTYFP
jgi:hypothetical protein